MRAAVAVPGVPRDEDGPVFREPWEARPLRWRWRCTSAACSPGRNGRQTLGAQIKRAQAAGDPDTGETYYRHWLATLERLVAAKGVATSETLHRYRDAWDHAADRTPHGAPIELTPGISVALQPSLRAKRSNPCRQRHGLLRRYAPRMRVPAYSRQPFARNAQAGHSPQP